MEWAPYSHSSADTSLGLRDSSYIVQVREELRNVTVGGEVVRKSDLVPIVCEGGDDAVAGVGDESGKVGEEGHSHRS